MRGKQTLGADSMLLYRGASVADCRLAMKQHCINVSSLLGAQSFKTLAQHSFNTSGAGQQLSQRWCN